MARNDTTSAIIDSILKTLVSGVALSTLFVAPNAVQGLGKPLSYYLKKLDKRGRERELRRVLAYMKSRDLIKLTSDDYEHGVVVTKSGKKRAEQANFESLEIPRPSHWDKTWRLVLFDIPEGHRNGRVALIGKLKMLGFVQLQQSAWIHPYPCRQEIEIVTQTYNVSRYVSYIETSHIDNHKQLIRRFAHKYKID